jgi:hypothetical protein
MKTDTKWMEKWERYDLLGDEADGIFMRNGLIYNPAYIVRISLPERNFERDCYYIWAAFVDENKIKIKFSKKEAAEKFYQDIMSSWYPDNGESK